MSRQEVIAVVGADAVQADLDDLEGRQGAYC